MRSLREESCHGFVLCDDREPEPSLAKALEARLVFEVLVAVAGEIRAVRIASHREVDQTHTPPARSCRVEVY